MTTNNLSLQRLGLIFNEWNRRYASDPEKFISSLTENGEASRSYGEMCAAYFTELEQDMDSLELLPKI